MVCTTVPCNRCHQVYLLLLKHSSSTILLIPLGSQTIINHISALVPRTFPLRPPWGCHPATYPHLKSLLLVQLSEGSVQKQAQLHLFCLPSTHNSSLSANLSFQED
ncbi:hypothetical protein FQA47_010096 [Oryzias melastigma]|uniref:Uncharacterized protein n=1 Tax=Oryzias melastigma TaxID=30732 RepID=A0A834KWT0_ORYME|nr:hypothetical protein FQA47_010096 [Oryzias melastigma]